MLDWLSHLSIRWILMIVGLLLMLRVLALRTDFLPGPRRRVVAESAETFAVAMVMVFLVLHRFVFQLFFIPSESMVPTLLIHDRILVNRFIYRFHPPQRQDIVVFRAPKEASPDPKDFVKRLIGLPGETVAVVPDRVLIDGRPLVSIINRGETGDASGALQVSPESRVEVSGTRLLVDGRCVLALSATGRASLENGALLVGGERVHTFGEGETPRPVPLPDSFRQAGHATGTAFWQASRAPIFVIRGRKLAIEPGHVLINGKPLAGEQYIRQTPRYLLSPRRLGADEYFVLGDNRNLSHDSHRWGALKGTAIVGKAWAMFWPPNRMGLVN